MFNDGVLPSERLNLTSTGRSWDYTLKRLRVVCAEGGGGGIEEVRMASFCGRASYILETLIRRYIEHRSRNHDNST